MDKNVYELLKDIDSQIEKNEVNEWEVVANIFADAIKRKGLSKKQVHEINKRILKEVRKDKRININY
jgi:hypothetical protein